VEREIENQLSIDDVTGSASALSAILIVLSIIFDVGYFSGVDINFFTLFSLSEHTLFAFEALPQAAVILVALSVGFFICNAAASPPEVRALNKRWRPAAMLALSLTVTAFIITFMLTFWLSLPPSIVFRHYRNTIISAGLAQMGIFLFQQQKGRIFLGSVTKSTAFTVLIPILIVSFCYGRESARIYTSSEVKTSLLHTLTTKDSQKIKTRVVRSGEKGLLIYDLAQNLTRFLKWDDVTEIQLNSPLR
jgi:hypothetical protein